MKKYAVRFLIVSMLIACIPVEETKSGDDDDDDNGDDDTTAFGDDDDDDDDDNIGGDDDDDNSGDDDDDDDTGTTTTTTGYDAECWMGAQVFCFCGTYYGYEECSDADLESAYNLCINGEDGGAFECMAGYIDADYYVDCAGAMGSCF